MQAPSDWWTIGSATAAALWSTVGSLYTRRRVRPVYANATRARRHAEAAQSSGPHWAKRAHLAKAQRLVAINHQELTATKQWNNRVYTPVAVALAASTLVLALWGVF